MKVTLPAWDRKFFQLDIATIKLEKSDTATALKEQLVAQPAELYYLFLDSTLESHWKTELSVLGAQNYGHQIQFSQTLREAKTVDSVPSTLKVISPESSSESLYQLAIASGIYSRFRLDPYLKPHFERLYRYWLDLAFSEPAKYFLLAVPDGNGFSGLLLGSTQGTTGRIELLAVAESARRHGVAQTLWQYTMTQFIQKDINVVSVGTQQENVAACRFYKKANFPLQSSTAVWHLWSQQ